MKKVGAVLAGILVFASVQAVSAGQVKIVVDGTQLPVYGEIVNGTTLVPVREISEALGADVSWDASQNMVVLSRPVVKINSSGIANTEIRNVSMVIGSKEIYIDGMKASNLDVPAQIINNKTMIPVRAVSGCFEADVSWDNSTKTVSVKKDLNGNYSEAKEKQVLNKAAEADVIKGIVGQKVEFSYPEWLTETEIKGFQLNFINEKYAELYHEDVGLYKMDYFSSGKVCDLTGYDEDKQGIQTVNGLRIKNENGQIYFNTEDLLSMGLITE